MQNNLSMTERWAGLTIEKAEKTGNKYYLASVMLIWPGCMHGEKTGCMQKILPGKL